MNHKELCQQVIRGCLEHGENAFSSWHRFDLLRDKGIIDEKTPLWKLHKAVAYGKQQRWLKAGWMGVGLTPYTNSARRKT